MEANSLRLLGIRGRRPRLQNTKSVPLDRMSLPGASFLQAIHLAFAYLKTTRNLISTAKLKRARKTSPASMAMVASVPRATFAQTP